jgi:hypothetical protein
MKTKSSILNTKKNKKLKDRGIKIRPQNRKIIIDEKEGLVFKNQGELIQYFSDTIDALEDLFDKNWKSDKNQISSPSVNHQELLDLTLDEPDEIWHDSTTTKKYPIFHFIRYIDELHCFNIASAYVNTEDDPTFIFMHFLCKDPELLNTFRIGDLIYDRAHEEIGFGCIEGDALSDGDPLALGLFISMLKVRSEQDIAYENFKDLGQIYRQETIENPDEIWRSKDSRGQTLVNFIKEFPESEIKDLSYICVTLEDESSSMHTLLFSFPTNDENLIERYQHDENMQAEEVTQESSH